MSLDFLYTSTELRQRIQQLRDQQRTQPGGPATRHAAADGPETTSSVVATLTAQLTDLRHRHHEETTRLRRELEAAHGENLALRRRVNRRQLNSPAPRHALGSPSRTRTQQQ